jgi:hypothetical protein
MSVSNFSKWFEGSKAVNAEGLPMLFHHKSLSKTEFVRFEYGKNKNPFGNTKGFYFVENKDKALVSHFGSGVEYCVYLKMKNPLIIYDQNCKQWDENGHVYDTLVIHDEFYKVLVEKGYDSVIIKHDQPFYEYVVFESSQIKSADKNNGNFSVHTDNILE